MTESELFEPVKQYLEDNGYEVQAEVNGCDVTAISGDDLIVIELKTAVNLRLLVQATQRQRLADSVYVAIPRPETGMRMKRWRQTVHLLRRLELGLIVVSLGAKETQIQVIHHPIPLERRKNRKNRRALLREISGRSGSYNSGGVSKQTIMTAYRESCIFIACCLERFGPSSPAALRAIGTGPKTQSILYNNHYGWFERIDKGVYSLHPTGQSALGEYEEIADHYRAKIVEL